MLPIIVTDTPTHCPYCALQCGMLVRGQGQAGLLVAGNAGFPVNRGELCIKGQSSGELLAAPDRLRQPLMRDAAGRLAPATWGDALDRVAAGFRSMARRFGPASVAVFGSGALTNEKAYALGKFARVVLRTPNIDYNGRYCMSSAAGAMKRALGLDRGLPFPVSDIARAACVLSWGSNWAETMPPLRRWFDEQRQRGGQLIVVDPRRSATASLADLHLQPVPGTDLALSLGMLFVAVDEGLVDEAYVAARTTNYEAARAVALTFFPARVERVTGVSEKRLRSAVRAMARAPSAIFLSGRGPEQQSKGVDTVLSFINFMLAIGKVGVEGSGFGTLTGQGNGQGGREHGQKADQLPGYRSIEDAADRAAVARAWGIAPDELPARGKSAVELLDALGAPEDGGGGVRGLLVMGSNVVVASPDAARVRERLRSLELLVVVDTVPNETAELAHVVLPTLLWAEEDGTMTNLEGRVLLRRRALTPPQGPRSDLEILRELAGRLDAAEAMPSSDPSAVFDELARITRGAPADYSGLSHARLEREGGVFWPCSSVDHPGTPRMFLDRFAHADGRATFHAVDHREAAESPDADYPYYFTTGRYREHYNSGAQTRRVGELARRRPEPLLEVHPSVLRRLSLDPDQGVLVESRRGRVWFRVRPSAEIRPDTVFAPFHWGGARSANLLTNPALDPSSRMPEFKVCAVRLVAPEPGGEEEALG